MGLVLGIIPIEERFEYKHVTEGKQLCHSMFLRGLREPQHESQT